ncbi:MAG TPA: PQQ-binding-like beta-propeller repeat protein [Pirellulales bacterium]|nr:PQQ-binding-like beta-propeller repeat protein [Pirellulales bacterium]
MLRSVRCRGGAPRRSPGLVLALAGLMTCGADWLQFRGNDSTGVSAETAVPTSWGQTVDGKSENIAWRADLPGRGVSSPIVVSGKVIVTASSGYKQDRLHVLAFDAATGTPAWQRQFWATGRTLCHPTMAVAAPTPASDGRRIFAFFSSNDMACLDLDGNLLWFRGLAFDYPTAGNDVGMAASPLVAAGTVVAQVENLGDSFATGLDARSGESLWRLQRGKAMNWTSPALWRGKTPADDVVLLQSPKELTAHHPRTGEPLWALPMPASIIPSVVAQGDGIYVPSAGLTALKRRSGDEPPEVVWQDAKLAPANASPVVDKGRIYTLSSASVLTCGDTLTGKILWRLRLAGPFWATPAIAAGHAYCVNDKGLAQVVRLVASDAGGEGELVSEHDFGEPILASPAVANGAVYFRGDRHLWKVAKP